MSTLRGFCCYGFPVNFNVVRACFNHRMVHFKMAAILRFGTLRACRNIALITARNQLHYIRNTPRPTLLSSISPLLPRVSSARFLSDDVRPENEEPGFGMGQNMQNELEDDMRLPVDKRPPKTRIMSNNQYERMVQKLGTISSKGSLLQTFDTILEKEGLITPLQAYQLLRNCGKELMYESPEGRTNLAHVIWDKILASGIHADIMMYNALLSVYIQNYYDFNPLEVLEQIQDAGLEPNQITMTLIIKGFGQKGDIAGVFKVLEFMKAAEMPVNEPVYSALITAYWKSGDIEGAKGVLDIMRENGLDPGLESYTSLLTAYAENGDLVKIDETISEMQEKKVYPNHTVYLSLIDIFAKCGRLEIIPKVLEKPAVRRLVELDILQLMMSLASRGDIDAALILKDFIPTEGFSSPSSTPQFLLLKQVVTSKQPTDKILKVVETLNKEGIMKKVYETALDLSYGIREPEKTIAIIKEMFDKNILVKQHYFYPVFASLADRRDVKGTQEAFTMMAEHGLDIDPISLSYIIRSFGQPKEADVNSFMALSKDVPLSPYLVRTMAQLVMEAGHLEKLDSIFEYADSKIEDKRFFGQTYARAMKRSFEPRNAVNILKKLKDHGYTTLMPLFIYDALETCCKQEKGAKMGAEFIHLMLKEGLEDLMDSRSYTVVMKCLNLNLLHDDFYTLIKIMKEHNIPLNEHHYRQMIRMFAYLGDSRAAQFCFSNYKKLKEPDHNLYSFLISAYGHSKDGGFLSERLKENNPKKIVKIYKEMKELGLEPKDRAIPYVMMSFLALGHLDEAIKLKEEFGPIGILSYRLETSFLKAFADKGDVENAMKILEKIKNSDKMHLSTYCYTLALSAFTHNGDIESQRRLLEEMKERNIRANSFTYDEMMNTYLLKGDVEGALGILEESKSVNAYPTTNASLRLADVCGDKALERFDSVIAELLDNIPRGRTEGSQTFFMHGLIFVCLKYDRVDLTERILEKLPYHSHLEYGKVSAPFARRGEFEAVLKCKRFLEGRNMDTSSLLIHLIRAYDIADNPEGSRQAYDDFIANGGSPWNGLQIVLGNILRKHGMEVPFTIPQRGQRQQRDYADLNEKADDEYVVEDFDSEDVETSEAEVREEYSASHNTSPSS